MLYLRLCKVLNWLSAESHWTWTALNLKWFNEAPADGVRERGTTGNTFEGEMQKSRRRSVGENDIKYPALHSASQQKSNAQQHMKNVGQCMKINSMNKVWRKRVRLKSVVQDSNILSIKDAISRRSLVYI